MLLTYPSYRSLAHQSTRPPWDPSYKQTLTTPGSRLTLVPDQPQTGACNSRLWEGPSTRFVPMDPGAGPCGPKVHVGTGGPRSKSHHYRLKHQAHLSNPGSRQAHPHPQSMGCGMKPTSFSLALPKTLTSGLHIPFLTLLPYFSSNTTCSYYL